MGSQPTPTPLTCKAEAGNDDGTLGKTHDAATGERGYYNMPRKTTKRNQIKKETYTQSLNSHLEILVY